MVGDGHYIYEDGSEYKGNFKNGKFDGIGIYHWPIDPETKTGHSYKGFWLDGKMHGKGEFYHKDGMKMKGAFANNLHFH